MIDDEEQEKPIRDFFEKLDKEIKEYDEELIKELNSIIPNDDSHNQDKKINLLPDTTNNSYDIIIHKPRMTGYDHARARLKRHSEELDALQNKPRTHAVVARIVLAERGIEAANIAIARAQSEVGRKRNAIDAWRNGEGRQEYNKRRRRVRATANESLKYASDEAKRLRKRNQDADRQWAHRQKKAGKSESEISIGLQYRIANRNNK